MPEKTTVKIGLLAPVNKNLYHTANTYFLNFYKQAPKMFPQWRSPNNGILTVASLVPDGWEIDLIEEFVDEINFDIPYDIIGISGMTQQMDDMKYIAGEFRKRGVYTVAGGIHATVMPDEVSKFVDTVMIGEVEDTFPRFCSDFQNNSPLPRYKPTGIVDMTESSIPRFDLLKKKYGCYPIQTSRGCPHQCNFCAASNIYGKKYRMKDTYRLIEEVKFLKKAVKNPFVSFVDDNMLVNKTHSAKLVEKLIPLNIEWQAISDISIAEEKDFLKLLSEAGCRELFIGFESLNSKTISSINKNQWKSKQVHHYQKHLENIQQAGIRVFGAFIIGFDHDTPEDFQRIQDFVTGNGILAQFTILTPLPGTQLYSKYKAADRLLKNKSWKDFTFVDCVIKHPHFSPDDLERQVASLYESSYSGENIAKVMRIQINAQKNLIK